MTLLASVEVKADFLSLSKKADQSISLINQLEKTRVATVAQLSNACKETRSSIESYNQAAGSLAQQCSRIGTQLTGKQKELKEALDKVASAQAQIHKYMSVSLRTDAELNKLAAQNTESIWKSVADVSSDIASLKKTVEGAIANTKKMQDYASAKLSECVQGLVKYKMEHAYATQHCSKNYGPYTAALGKLAFLNGYVIGMSAQLKAQEGKYESLQKQGFTALTKRYQVLGEERQQARSIVSGSLSQKHAASSQVVILSNVVDQLQADLFKLNDGKSLCKMTGAKTVPSVCSK